MCMCLCEYKPHLWEFPKKPEKSNQSSGAAVTVVVSCNTWVLGTKLSSLEEQQDILITEPSLHTSEHNYKIKSRV